MLTYFSAEISVKGIIYDDPATKVLPNHRARMQATKIAKGGTVDRNAALLNPNACS
jgi:hypothetical protein